MHELSVTQNLLDIALRHARQSGAAQITDLYLVIGQLSSVIDDSVQFYWDFISKDTPAEGARLHFRRVPARLECQECRRAYSLEGEGLLCPACGTSRVKVLAGDEFTLEAIDVETAPGKAQVPA
jgi:hydrogenase nickel incorporation protein HypA/HybF